MLLANTIYTDVIPWLIVASGFIGAAWINKRGATGDALKYLQDANQILHKENTELKRERQNFLAEIAALKAKTDVALAIRPIVTAHELHEKRAEQRWTNMMRVLDMIAKRLGPEESAE